MWRHSVAFSVVLNAALADRRRVTDNCSESRQILVKLVFIRSRGSSVVMISCSKWNLIVIWSLLCLCAWTEASYYETVSTNPSYLTINIFQRKEDARKFLLPLGRDRSAIWGHFLTSCFFYNSQGKVNHRSAEEKQGKVIQIRPSLKFYSRHKSSDRIQFSPRYTTT